MNAPVQLQQFMKGYLNAVRDKFLVRHLDDVLVFRKHSKNM